MKQNPNPIGIYPIHLSKPAGFIMIKKPKTKIIIPTRKKTTLSDIFWLLFIVFNPEKEMLLNFIKNFYYKTTNF